MPAADGGLAGTKHSLPDTRPIGDDVRRRPLSLRVCISSAGETTAWVGAGIWAGRQIDWPQSRGPWHFPGKMPRLGTTLDTARVPRNHGAIQADTRR